jgi:hypothetical protein
MSSGGPVEATIIGKVLEWAWAGIALLVGIVWKKHNEEIADIKGSIQKVDENMNGHTKYLDGRIDSLERATVPRSEYEQNRKEMREGQIQIFARLDHVGQALARIEGKLDK